MEPNTLNVQGCGVGGATGPAILGVKLPPRLMVNVEHSQTLTLARRSQPILPFLLSLAVHRSSARKWKITLEVIEKGYTMYEVKCTVRLGNFPGKHLRGRRKHKQASRAHKEDETAHGAERPWSRTPAATRRSCAYCVRACASWYHPSQ